MKVRMSEVPAEMEPAMKSVVRQIRNAPLQTGDAMCVSGRRETEK